MLFVVLVSVFGLAFGQTSNLVDTLKTSTLESTLVSLIDQAGLTDVLSQGGPFTIFAPDNRAFDRLPAATLASLKNDTAKLAEILKYHVVNGIYNSSSLHINELMLDSLAGPQIRINYYFAARRTYTAEGAPVTYKDKYASNGVIHRIDEVMMPPVGNIVDVLTNDGSFTTLLAAANAAGLVDALKEGPYTLMAPNDHAFERLGNATVAKLLQNPKLLGDILKYHILHGTLYSSGMHTGSIHTLEEADRERIFGSFFGNVIVDGHRVFKPDMSATNGVVHELDYVLIPSSLRSQIASL